MSTVSAHNASLPRLEERGADQPVVAETVAGFDGEAFPVACREPVLHF